MSGTQISDMTDSLTVFPNGAFVPMVVESNTGGLVTTENYRYNAGLYLAKYSTLAAATGAALVGSTGPSTVQADLDARPTSAALSASSGSALVGFIQSGTGAVARTVQAKTRESVTPLDFGAVGDGVTNDTAPLALALAAAIAQSKPLDLLGLTYGITAPGTTAAILPITAGVELRNGTLKILNPGTGYGAMLGSTDAAVDLSGLLLDNVTFDQDMEGQTPVVSGSLLTFARMCVKAKRGDGIDVRNCNFINVLGTNTIELNGDGNTANCTVAGCTFRLAEPNGATAYFDSSTVYVTGDGLKVTGNTFINASFGSANGTCAIEVHPGYLYEVSNNIIYAYHTGINVAGVYETDSTQGVVTGNTMEVLRKGIALYSVAYLTHNSGYGIDGLVLNANNVRVRNALPSLNSGGGAGLIGIALVAGATLSTRGIIIGGANRIEFDLEGSTPDWTGVAVAGAGIMETSGTVVHEGFEIGSLTIVNCPLFGITLCVGGGILKNCRVVNPKIVNPGSTARSNGSIGSVDFRTGIWISPNDVQSSLLVSATLIDDLGTSLMHNAVAVQCATSVTESVDISGGIYVTGGTTTGYAYALQKFDNNIVPKVALSCNLAAPTFFAGNTFKIGSTTCDRAGGISYEMLTDAGTSFTRMTPYGVLTVGTLPTASTASSVATAYVTDANATTLGAIVAAGGANNVPVHSNGTNWLIG